MVSTDRFFADRSALVEAESLLSLLEFVIEGVESANPSLPAETATPKQFSSAQMRGAQIRGVPWNGLKLTIGQIRDRLQQVLCEGDSRRQNTISVQSDQPLATPNIPLDTTVAALASEQTYSPPVAEQAFNHTPQPPPVLRPAAPNSAAPHSAAPNSAVLSTAVLSTTAPQPTAPQSTVLQPAAPQSTGLQPRPQNSATQRSEESLSFERKLPEQRAHQPRPMSSSLASRIQMAPTPSGDLGTRPRSGKTRELNPDREESFSRNQGE